MRLGPRIALLGHWGSTSGPWATDRGSRYLLRGPWNLDCRDSAASAKQNPNETSRLKIYRSINQGAEQAAGGSFRGDGDGARSVGKALKG